MTLETLAEFGYNLSLLITSSIADSLSTKIFAEKKGISKESNKNVRKLMKKHGINKGLIISDLIITSREMIFLTMFYGMDYALGTENNLFNSHNVFTYGASLLKTLATTSNLADTWGYSRTGEILGFIPDLCNKFRPSQYSK